MEEIPATIKSLNNDSATGPDGYNGYFFMKYWDIIKSDLFDAVSEFFA